MVFDVVDVASDCDSFAMISCFILSQQRILSSLNICISYCLFALDTWNGICLEKRKEDIL